MKHTLVIASRELREKSRLFVFGAAMSLLPFVSVIASHARMEALAMASTLSALVFGLGVAIMLGASTIAGELVERRLSFYFAKPVAPAALWLGKVIAALLMSFFCFGIIIGVSAPFAGKELGQIWNAQLLGIAALLIMLMFLVSHTLNTMVRSHSSLIGLDFLLGGVCLVAIYFIVRPFVFAGSAIGLVLGGIIGAATMLTLFFAPLWQLERGRSDIKRSHAALSRAIWTSAAVVLIAVGAYAAWVVNVAPASLTRISDVQQSPAGTAFFVTGTTAGRGDYRASFIVDADSGKYQRVDTMPWWSPRFSQSGNAVAWVQPVSFSWINRSAELELYTKRLDQPAARAMATGIRRTIGSTFALSPDGTRVAVTSGRTIAVQELGTQRIIASVPIEGNAFVTQMFFTSSDVLRVHQARRNSKPLEIYELDVPSKKLAKTGEVASDRTYMDVHLSSDGSRMFLPRSGVVADGRTGAILAKIPVTTPSLAATAILSDGTVAVSKRVQGKQQTTVSLVAPDGTLKHELTLPVTFAWMAGEVEGGKLILFSRERENSETTGRGFRMYVVDTARGTIERTMNDLRGPAPNWTDPRLSRFAANAKLGAVNAEGRLVTWNPATGAVTPLSR